MKQPLTRRTAPARNAAPPESPPSLGERLRALRRQRGLTLEAVAGLTGISLSTLSKIENDKTAVGFEIIMRLCDCLDVPIGNLAGVRLFAPNVRSVTRGGDGEHIDSPNYLYELLSSDLVKKGVFPSVITCKHHSIDEITEWSVHEGEEFLHVLSGVLELHSKFYSPLRLNRGDSVHYDSSEPHAMISVSSEPAVVLSVCCSGANHDADLPGSRLRAKHKG